MSARTIIVTGASSGLGAHFAEMLAKDGARVILAARSRDKLAALAEVIRKAGGEAETVAMDVSDPESVKRAFGAVSGRIDVVINNAGIAATSPAIKSDPAEFGSVLDTNVKGVFHVAQEAARRMRGDGGGAIVNVASILGFRVAGNVAAYTASKAAVVQLTKALALEWARYGVRVNALCPGYIETPLNSAFFASDAGKALIARIPQRRLGRLADLDAPLRLLCSEEAGYMTGASLVVDGGHLCSSL